MPVLFVASPALLPKMSPSAPVAAVVTPVEYVFDGSQTSSPGTMTSGNDTISGTRKSPDDEVMALMVSGQEMARQEDADADEDRTYATIIGSAVGGDGRGGGTLTTPGVTGQEALIGLWLGALAVAIGSTVVATRSITRPLGRATGVANDVAQGRLSQHQEDTSRDETGQLPMIASRVAEFYEAKLARSLDRVVGIAGPAAIIVISLVVGGLIVSVMTALLSVSQIIG